MNFKQFCENKQAGYSALVLDETSRQKLLNFEQIKELITPEMQIIAHHMTIKMGGLEGTQHYGRLGQKESIEASRVGTNEINSVVAVMVNGISDNKIPHVTIAVDRKKGAKPVDSNKITSWTPLTTPIKLSGVVLEII
jgi:hypothetical protein